MTASDAENIAEEKSAELAPITITIPVSQQLANTASTPQSAPAPFRSGNRGRGRGRFFGKGGKQDNTGSGRSLQNTPVSSMLIVWMLHH